jgi:uncharacterized protein YfaP (DUF2135 family)
MIQRIARVDLADNARDFGPIALEPGLPMLDRANANGKTVGRWLGRFAAEPLWSYEGVDFFVGDGHGGRLEATACRPATPERLRGPLKEELETLGRTLETVRPQTRTEETLHRLLLSDFRRLAAQPLRAGVGSHLIEYKDAQGKPRLVWCWGYQRQDQGPGRPAICPKENCRALCVIPSGGKPVCPSCHRGMVFPWKKTAAALAALLLVAAVGAYAWLSRPAAVLAGKVVDAADGSPVAGAEIALVGSDRTLKADEDGTFRLDRLPAGDAEIRVTADLYDSKKTKVTVARWAENKVEVVLTAAVLPRGQVVDALHGQPLADVRIVAEGAGGKPVRSGANGRFVVPTVEGAAAQLRFEAAGYRRQTVAWSRGDKPLLVKMPGSAALVGRILRKGAQIPIANAKIAVAKTGAAATTDEQGRFRLADLPGTALPIEASAAGFAGWAEEVALDPHQETPLDISLQGVAVAAGRAMNVATKKPVAGATVSLVGFDRAVKTDDKGVFRLEQLSPGNEKVRVLAEGFDAKVFPLEVKAEEETWVDLALVSATAPGGLVVDAINGQPIANAKVSIGVPGVAPLLTGADGRFDFLAVEEAAVKFDVEADGYRKQTVDWARGQEPLVVKLSGGTLILVQVRNKANQTPVAGAKVVLNDSDNPAETDEQGRCRLEGMRSGKHAIAVSAPGFARAEQSVDLAVGQEKTLDVDLTGGAGLSGRVIDAASTQPVAGATVAVQGTSLSATTDAAGKFTIVGVRGGAAQKLNVSQSGYAASEVAVPEVQADKDTPLPDIVLTGDATLSGIVTDENTQQPLRDVPIVLTAGDSKFDVKTDAKGVYARSGIRSGQPLGIEVKADKYGSFRETKSLSAGNTELNIALSRDATLAVQVIDAADPAKKLPVANARVKIAGKGIDKEAASNDAGLALFEHIPARPVQIDIAAEDYCPTKLETTPGDKTPVEAPLIRAASVTINTVCPLTEKNVPGLAKPLSLPVPNAAVNVAVSDKNKEVTKHTGRTDANGNLQLKGLPPGEAVIGVEGPSGFAPVQLKPISLKSGQNGPLNVPVAGTANIMVRVVQTADQKTPIANAAIQGSVGPVKFQGVSDAKGQFACTGMPPGFAQLDVTKTRHSPGSASRTLGGGENDIAVALSPLVDVRVRVVDPDKRPVAGAAVDGGGKRGTTDAKGEVLLRDVPAGLLAATGTKAGFGSNTINRAIAKDGELIEVPLKRTFPLRKQLIDALTGKPIANQLVTVEVGGQSFTATTDANGTFTIGDVPDGEVEIHAGGKFLPQKVSRLGPLRVVANPRLNPGEIRVVLTWNDFPKDLDLHLFGQGNQGIHVSYLNKAEGPANLDVDNKDGFGPETITIRGGSGAYAVRVADHANTGQKGDATLADKSAAEVKVYRHTGELSTFNIPRGGAGGKKGPVWDVCKILVGRDKTTVQAVNTFSDDLPK